MKGLRFLVMSIFLLFGITFSFAQKEANIWYFAPQVGLDFNNASPVVLMDGRLTDPNWGSASIADSNGNLLFYSDGKTVYNRNHQVMLNGSNLISVYPGPYVDVAQPVIIVPKPDNPNIYYVFTAVYNDGFRYSEIDMSLDNGLGGITTLKRILLAPTANGISATHHDNGQDFWVVTHGLDKNFYAILVTSTGVNITPIITPSLFSGNFDYYDWSILKIAPNGKKLVTYLDDYIPTLYDFNSGTGAVNNPITLFDVSVDFTGAEFSPCTNFLYISAGPWDMSIYQYDLNAVNIAASSISITHIYYSSFLQLGPDKKIYLINYLNPNYLAAINSPDKRGEECDFEDFAIYLNGKEPYFLPQSIQSYQYPTIATENVCLGEIAQFQNLVCGSYNSILWDFGDGFTTNSEAPDHIYASSGDYTVSLTVISGGESFTDVKTISVYRVPKANRPRDLTFCIPDPNYFTIDLTVQTQAILNGQDSNLFQVFYYASMDDYNNNKPILDPQYFTVFAPFDLISIVASAKNKEHPECDDFTEFNVGFIQSFSPSQNISQLIVCDDKSIGTDVDGLVMVDLTQKEHEILNGESALNFEFSYFTDTDLLNQIQDPNNYQNTSYFETIYVLVINKNNSICTGETFFNLEVNVLPITTPTVELKQCDDDLDGFSAFNLNEVLEEISPNFMNEVISFHKLQADAVAGINAIGNTTMYSNQVVSYDVVYARIENINGCFRTSKVNLIVSTTQIPSTFMRDFYACDNAGDGVSNFDFSNVNNEIEALFPLGQELVISYYQNIADALAEIDPIIDISNYTNTLYPYVQQIYVRVESKIDNACIGLGAHINLYVEPVPEFTVETPQIVCSSNPSFTVVLDPIESNPTENFRYSWTFNGVEVSTAPTLAVSIPGTYSVTLTKTDGSGCFRTKDIFVNASELSTVTLKDVTIVQLSDNNSITIDTSNLGLGDYEFALDNSFGSYQDEPYFDYVSVGMHTLYVRDKKGCGISQLEVFIMGFPKFFTPNDDGFHDTWNIVGLSNDYTRNSRIYIFDRYGKLLIQLDPKGANWDGTFNGEKLRSSDYWFVAELHNVDGTLTTYRGHFSLVR